MTAADTRRRIVDAAIETIKEEGIVGTSARAIARRGDFNQALIFYHFGSINEVLFAAIAETSRRRIDRYRRHLDGVTTLPELVDVAENLHREDVDEGNLTVLTQFMAGAANDPELGPRLRDAFDPWIEVVVDALEGTVSDTPYGRSVPMTDLGYAVSALFLGIELLSHLDPQRADDRTLFDSIGSIAEIVQTLLATGAVPEPASRPLQHIAVE